MSKPVRCMLVVLALCGLGWDIWERRRRRCRWGVRTSLGLAGDPINLLVYGDEKELVRRMVKAGWRPADRTTGLTTLKLGLSVVFGVPDESAPVSNLYFCGHVQDLAFEEQIGGSAVRRHHVRFWKNKGGWWGAATMDVGVGFSGKSGMVTHHIDGEVDRERDKVMGDLGGGELEPFHWVCSGRNGGGDYWWTDGNLGVVELEPTHKY